MTDPTPLPDQQLNDIETRAAHLYEYVQQPEEADILAGTDVPLLAGEVRRLRAEVERWRRTAYQVACTHEPDASAAEPAETLIGSITIRTESVQLDNGECLRDLAIGDSVELRAETGHEGLWVAAAFHGPYQDWITLQYAEVVEDCGQDPAVRCEFNGTRHAHPFDLDGKIRPRPTATDQPAPAPGL